MKGRMVLIGFSAVGKSTVARCLAERMGWRFLDLDAAVMQRAGKTIRQIFHGEGEGSFRTYEAHVLQEVRRWQGVVVATGAGTPLVERLRRLMNQSFFIICLEARPETIYQRLLKDRETGTNPVAELLTRGDDPVGHIAYLKAFRQPYYTIAHWTVHTDWLTPEQVADEVLHGWVFYSEAHARGLSTGTRHSLRYPLGDARESDCPYDPAVWEK